MDNYTHSLETIFSNKCFRVPDYQRGYAWGKEQCKDLLEDLELLQEDFDHYTGTLVFHKNGETAQDDEGGTYAGYDIVDGQQRITSLVILLSVIKASFADSQNYERLASGIGKKYLFTKRLIDGNNFYKLTLNDDCKEFFKTNILGRAGVTGKTIRSHERLSQAKTIFEEYLSGKKKAYGDTYYDWLLTLYKKITTQLKMGMYIVNNEAEVGVIFEVMNNRGKDLTELEKVKNYLLYLTTKINLSTKDKLSAKINSTWSNIYRRLMTADLGGNAENQFLRAHWLMYHNYNRRDWSGSKSIKEKFSLRNYQHRDKDLLNDLTDYVKSLDESSIAFVDLEKPNRSDSFNSFEDRNERQSVEFWSTKLVRTRTLASFRPLLIAVRLKHPENAVFYRDLVQFLEKFAFRVYNMQGKRADTGQSAIFQYAYNLYNDKSDIEETMKEMKELLYYYSKPSTFETFWDINPDDNNWYKWGALKYFLYEYEEHLADGRAIQLPWNAVTEKKLENTIEHILPQTPNDSDGYWEERFTKEEIKIYLHDLGNLCLTYDNSSYQNKGFDKKVGVVGQDKPCYRNSPLFQERELVEYYPDWNVSSIEERRRKIVDWAKIRWHEDLDEFKETPEDIEEEFYPESQEIE